MRWKFFFVWDSYQEEFVKKHLGHQINCISTGAIYFTDSEVNSSEIPDNCIAVFDVQPFRESLYQPMCEPIEYYVYDTAKRFLHDINSVVSKSKHKIVFKRKRNIGNKVDKKYKFYLEKIEKENTVFQMVNPDIHALKLIEKSKAVISMPFTSTSILAKQMKKPTVFYDPLNMLCKDDIGSHGIEILSSLEELEAWINNLNR
jgi:polysaccharide biosynthesis PFTS motif protein